MLVYLSKKIAIPNHVKLHCISWNRDQGWIACGGESGLLKVLKLEVPSGPDARLQGIAASSNLSMNQTLEGHTGSVMCVTWNPLFRKLTTSDESGLIIVWMLHKGMWYEEMINNRNKSVVRDMKWTADGRKIAIVYEDGAVIVGSVDGNRLWGKELNLPLRFVEWSPDSKMIVFVTYDAEVWIYDADGGKVRSMSLIGQDHSSLGGEIPIASIHWYGRQGGTRGMGTTATQSYHMGGASSIYEQPFTLCIAFENGNIQLSRGEDESTAEILDTDLDTITYCRWSTRGNILAVVGTVKGTGTTNASAKSDKDKNTITNLVKFYNSYGRPIRSIRIPGETVSAISWEGGDLRLSLAVDSFIYFANIRHSYTWTYFLNTVVYSYPRPDRKEVAVVFWDLISLEAHTKYVSNLKFLLACGDLCAVIVSERGSTKYGPSEVDAIKGGAGDGGKDTDDRLSPKRGSGGIATQSQKNLQKATAGGGGGQPQEIYSIQLRNSIGAVVDSKVIPFNPKYVSMSPYHLSVANDRTVFAWQFQSQVSKAAQVLSASSAAAAAASTLHGADMSAYGAGSGSGAGGAEDDHDIGGGADGKAAAAARSQSRVRMFDIGSNTSFGTNAQSAETFQIITDAIADPIVCTATSDKYLVVGRKGGSITRFNLPHLTPENTYQVKTEPHRMELNCTSSKLGLIDCNGLFTILDLEARVNNDVGKEGAGGGLGGRLGSNSLDMDESESKGVSSTGGVSATDKNAIGTYFGKKLAVERKDVWDIRWSEDDPNMIVIMEKTKMVVFHGETAEDPVISSGYLARFKDLEIRVITLDDLMLHPDKIERDSVVDFESKSLREVRDKIAAEGLQAGYNYADKNSHPRLWKLLANAALEDLELTIAEKAFVRCGDYYGVQLVKQLAVMPDRMKARAEAAVYLNKFDEAESIYREIDRKDLAIQLRKRLGDYTRVVQLLQTGGGNDALVRESWDKIGDYYADRFKWKKAAQYYQLSRNFEQLAECYYRVENFTELAKLRIDLPDDSPLLAVLAKRFETVGMHEEAVDCYLRSGRPPKEAVDCCVMLNKWSMALELAEKYDYPQVEGLLIKYAMQLVSTDRKLEAVELFRVANKPTEAAILLGDIAENVANQYVNPALAKKLHVLAALEIERHRKRAMDMATQAAAATGQNGTIAQATAATLETLMMTALDTQGGANTLGGTLAATLGATLGGTLATGAGTKKLSKAFGNAWRGAAAYHYYMLALRHFYAGNLDAAMKTSIKLCEFDDVLNARYIYSLLCLTALKNKFYGTCSKAFVKLETLPNISEEDRDTIQTVAVRIFISNAPADPASLPEPYVKCLDVGRSFKACVLSGRAIQDSPSHMCKTCRHSMLEHEIENYNRTTAQNPPADSAEGGASNNNNNNNNGALANCPLCHSPLVISTIGGGGIAGGVGANGSAAVRGGNPDSVAPMTLLGGADA